MYYFKEQTERSRRQQDTPTEPGRPIRATRNTMNSSRNNGNQDSDDDSDDDQLLSQIASQSRTKRSPRAAAITPPKTTEFVDATSPIHQNGNSLPRTRENIRRKQLSVSTSSTTVLTSSPGYQSVRRSMTTTETSSQIEIRRNQVIPTRNMIFQISFSNYHIFSDYWSCEMDSK